MASYTAIHVLASIVGIDLSDWSSRSTESASHHTSQKPSLESRLLQCPPDVLLSICDHLDTTAALCFALACRDTHAICFSFCNKKLEPEQKKQLLCLLEGDRLGAGHYFCHTCVKLHPFDEAWAPQSDLEGSHGHGDYHCGNRDRFAPTGNSYDLTYAHARLVMNRRLYGPGHGIPLANICVQHQQHREMITVHCSTEARILEEGLFLHRAYAFTVKDAQVYELRQCTGSRDFGLCEHTSLFSPPSRHRQNVSQLHRQPWGGAGGFVPCNRATGSCGLCLMDYDISIAEAEDAGVWQITMNAYHMLGPCQTPDDWKWARFTEATRPHLFFPNRPNRRSSRYRAGAVFRLWAEGEALRSDNEAKAAQESSYYPLLLSFVSWPWSSSAVSQ